MNAQIVHDNKTEYIVPSRDSKALSDAIIKMFTESANRIEMEKNAYQLFRNEFTLDIMLGKYKNIVDNIKEAK